MYNSQNADISQSGSKFHMMKFNLLYDKNNSLQKKIKLEQVRKEIN